MYRRSSGILLPIISLPGKFGIGDMGKEAFAFVDFLHDSRQQLWQILPINPTGKENSPYNFISAFAGNILFISPEKLLEEGFLEENDIKFLIQKNSGTSINYHEISLLKKNMLRKAYLNFRADFEKSKEPYFTFLGKNSWWLNDYTLFKSIKEEKGINLCWNKWEDKIKHHNSHDIDVAILHFSKEIEFRRFVQYIFFKQWTELKTYANKRGVKIIGDMPLYVPLDCADVWSNQDMFLLDGEGKKKWIEVDNGGQFCENPLYDWDRIKERNFDWWLSRFHFNLNMFDIIRINHFRKLKSFRAVPAGEKTTKKVCLMKANGEELLERLEKELGTLSIIAEDDNSDNEEVEKLRERFNIPGIKILQQAFSSNEKNSSLPHNYPVNSIVYTATQNNNTNIGWIKDMSFTEQENLRFYISSGWTNLHKKVIETAWASVSRMAIVPMQDVLELDSRARMNTPGVSEGNWEWRMDRRMLKKKQWKLLRTMTKKYNRQIKKDDKQKSTNNE